MCATSVSLSGRANSVILLLFALALILAMIAVLIFSESFWRLLHPVLIAFSEAIFVAVLGLGVNLTSARLLRRQPGDRNNDDRRDNAENHLDTHHLHDLNLRAAYVHVLADAAVSLMAVFGLTAAWRMGWIWIDPVVAEKNGGGTSAESGWLFDPEWGLVLPENPVGREIVVDEEFRWRFRWGPRKSRGSR